MKRAIEKYSIPLDQEESLKLLLESIGDSKIVLLGEASHGTSEFYKVRAEITKKLIKEKGFTQIAVEGGWPSCQHVNQYIKNNKVDNKNTRDVLTAFNTWPTWMWANEEIIELIDWLKSYNIDRNPNKKVGFYGVDIYSLWESLEELFYDLTSLKRSGSDLALAKKVFACFQPFNHSTDQYVISTIQSGKNCSDDVNRLLAMIKDNKNQYPKSFEQDLNLMMNALIIKNAEAYYRASIKQDASSWNIRDNHMVEAINTIEDYHNDNAKIIVWEHNTHIGDARATTMKDDGSVNVGQLLREKNKSGDIFVVGFGTHSGTVTAADSWGDPSETMSVPLAKKGSWEDSLHNAGAFDKMIIFNDHNRKFFTEWLDHRAIGVTYDPAYEKYNYVPSQIGYRYDAFIHIDKTNALKPLYNRKQAD